MARKSDQEGNRARPTRVGAGPITIAVSLGLLSSLLALVPVGEAGHLSGFSAVYTTAADFSEGSFINLVTSGDDLVLSDSTGASGFMWVSNSGEGTVIKIDTATGAVLGEYQSAPDGRGRNPSRTTVDQNGNVWVANRDESTPPAGTTLRGAIVKIGLEENGQCVDRNSNGVIDTSTGLNDVRPWTNAGGADSAGGVSTAADECILHFVRVHSHGTRHLSVNADNNVWVSGTGTQEFDLVNGATGAIMTSYPAVPGCGGYGGLIDPAGVIWSARSLLRWDTALPLSDANSLCYDGSAGDPPFHDSYGLCIDPAGNVWNTQLSGDRIHKFAPDGTLLGSFPHGFFYAQGCVADSNGHIWVAHSIIGGGSSVGHLLNDGTYVGNVGVGSGPTGVAVDNAGKVWATNYHSRTVSRIDPAAGPIGGGGVPVGAVDFTSGDLGGVLYNYSDMTGSTLIGAPSEGTWSRVHDSGAPDTVWNSISWSATTPGTSTLTVTARTSNDGVTFSAPSAVTNGGPLALPAGQFLKVDVLFKRNSPSPVLHDITFSGTAAAPPDPCPPPSGVNAWFLEEVEHPVLGSPYLLMCQGDHLPVSGADTVVIPDGRCRVWASNVATPGPFTFSRDGWYGNMDADEGTVPDFTKVYDSRVGAYDSSSPPGSPETPTTPTPYAADGQTRYRPDGPVREVGVMSASTPAVGGTFVVPAGGYLLYIHCDPSDGAATSLTLLTDGGSWISASFDDPTFPTPELGTILLFAVGLVGLGAVALRRWRD